MLLFLTCIFFIPVDVVLGVEEEPLEVLEECVLVLLHEAVHIVGDVAGVVPDHKVLIELQVLVLGGVNFPGKKSLQND